MTPLASWLLFAAAAVTVLVTYIAIDRYIDRRPGGRRERIRGFDEEYRYHKALDAVRRQQATSNARIGHKRNGNTNV